MYRRLKDPFALRGWQGLPYGITDTKSGRTMFLDAAAFQAASFCDGQINLDSPLVLALHKVAIEKLEDQGVIEECTADSVLQPWQKYRKSDGRFAASVHWSITGKCNLNCRHCYMSAPQAKYGELSTDQCLAIIDQITYANIGSVSLTGGEPLVRKDFWQLVDVLQERRINIRQIYSNGLLVSDELLEKLQERSVNCSLSLSFDGCGCHDWMRGAPGAEQSVIDAVKRACRHGFQVSIETTLYKDNLHGLRLTYELLKSLGIRSWKMSPAMSVGNWEQEEGRYDIPVKELYAAYLEMIRWHNDDGAPLELLLGGFYYRSHGSKEYHIPFAKFDGTKNALSQTACRSCRLHPYIMADGKLLPCIPMTGTSIEKEMPSLLDTTISQALNDSRYFEIIDTRLEALLKNNAECSACEHKMRCGMGCRACAIDATGDFYGIDPHSCYFFKNAYEEKISEIVRS